MKTGRTIFAALVTTLLAAPLLHTQTAGIVLVEEETAQGLTATNQIQLTADRLRAESRASGEHMAFVFDNRARVARIINLDKRTYSELSHEDLQQMTAAIAQITEQFRNLPPEQREMFERMMGGQGMPGMPEQPISLTYRRTGQDTVGEWSCTNYEALSGSERIMELCAADPRALGLTPADFQIAEQFAEFMKTLMPQFADQAAVFGAAAGEQGFEGVPVRRTIYQGGSVVSVSELRELRREPIPDSAFEVPAGFTRETLPGVR